MRFKFKRTIGGRSTSEYHTMIMAAFCTEIAKRGESDECFVINHRYIWLENACCKNEFVPLGLILKTEIDWIKWEKDCTSQQP